MTMLSNSLEIDFHTKDNVSVRFPTVNFLDPQSLQSWLEARKIALDAGLRFQIRIMLYISYFLVLTASLFAFIFLHEYGFISKGIMSTEAWILLRIYTSLLTIACFAILLPSSYTNT